MAVDDREDYVRFGTPIDGGWFYCGQIYHSTGYVALPNAEQKKEIKRLHAIEREYAHKNEVTTLLARIADSLDGIKAALGAE